jgi:hypothetical protein
VSESVHRVSQADNADMVMELKQALRYLTQRLNINIHTLSRQNSVMATFASAKKIFAFLWIIPHRKFIYLLITFLLLQSLT